MAEDIVSGLFGMSPTDVALARQRQQQEAAAAYANMDALQAAKAGMFNLGGTIGRVGGQMLGLQDPMVVEAQQRQQGLAGMDVNDPQSILEAAKRFGDMGDTQTQMRLQMLANQRIAEAEQAKLTAAKTQREIAQAEEIPRMRHEEAMARVAQQAEAAKQRSEDMRLSMEMRRQSAAEANALRRDLAMMQMQSKRDLAEVARAAKQAPEQEKEAIAADSLRTTLDAADELINHPGRLGATGKSAILNPLQWGTDEADFLAKLDTFKAKTFIPMVSQLKGMGALSDAEGKKLSDAVGSLNPKMTEKGFKDSLQKIMAEMNLAYRKKTGKDWTGSTSESLYSSAVPAAPAQAAQTTGSGWSIKKVP